MRILEIETFGRGGLTHYAFNLSSALAARGHEVTLATAAGFELGDLTAAAPGVEIVEITGRVSRRWGDSAPALAGSAIRKVEAIADAFSLEALAHKCAPDVIHLHSTNPIALLQLALLRRLDAPLVETAHVVTPHEPLRGQRVIYRRIHRLGDLVIAHSEFDRGRLERELGVEPHRLTVIPHGEYGFFAHATGPVDRAAARREIGLEQQAPVALFFGYIREYKGLDLLLEAWPTVAKAVDGARLVIAGDPGRLDGRRREQLERWASRVGAIHRFGYVPFSEVGRYFAVADVIAMPYRRLSQSGVLYLALALGLPVVATRVGALEEVLCDGDSALLVNPESPADLALALIRVLGDETLRKRLAAGGRDFANQHSWPAIAEQTERVFTELVERQSDRS